MCQKEKAAKVRTALWAACLTAGLLAGCEEAVLDARESEAEMNQEEAGQAYLTESQAGPATLELANSAQAAAVKHLEKLASEKKEGNLMISPFSYQECLGMIRLGTAGGTNKELASWLGTGPDAGRAAEALKAGRDTLKPLLEGGIVTTANGVWVSRDAKINPPYLDQVKKSFEAAVRSSAFPEPGLTEINAFAKEATKGRIEKILEELDPLTRMVLVNAIHFKDKWQEPFEKKLTQDEDFHSPDGVKKVPMMHGGKGFKGAKAGGFHFASTRFKTGLRIVFALPPSKGVPVEKAVAPLMAAANRGFHLQVNRVALPELKSEFKWDMKPTMQAMGVRQPFDPEKADFSPMSPEKLFITQVVQKTFVQFDEEGVEAAAVTAGVVGLTSMPMDPPMDFIANRPYAYVILDKNGMPLFLGIVRDPAKG